MKIQSIDGLNFYVGTNGEPEKLTIDFKGLKNETKEIVYDFLEDLYDWKIIDERKDDDVLTEDEAKKIIYG